MKKPIRAAIVGAGHRSLLYAAYAHRHPEELKITAVADPDPERRRRTAAEFQLPDDACFESAEMLAACPVRPAETVINGTMDHQHVATSIPLLQAGYDMLLEKPFATDEEELWQLAAVARQHGRKVLICHVLRHAPFYSEIRSRVAAGEIGRLFNLQLAEQVSFHHTTVSYVRGKHRSKALCHAGMLLAKCCHDIDLIVWMNGGTVPDKVASFGSRSFFRPENAPVGAGHLCLVDCPPAVEEKCLYSARKHYLDNPDRWEFYVWAALENHPNPTLADKERLLRQPENPFARCVFRHDNDVVDRQTVAIEFANGSTATLNMVGGCATGSRSINLIGERGEIFGKLEDGYFTVRRIVAGAGRDFSDEVVHVAADPGDTTGVTGGHGGGEDHLMADFVRVVRGEPPSLSTTSLEDSLYGHLLCFAADRAMEEGRVVNIASANAELSRGRA